MGRRLRNHLVVGQLRSVWVRLLMLELGTARMVLVDPAVEATQEGLECTEDSQNLKRSNKIMTMCEISLRSSDHTVNAAQENIVLNKDFLASCHEQPYFMLGKSMFFNFPRFLVLTSLLYA